MDILISKSLTLLVCPLGLAILLIIAGLVLKFAGRQTASSVVILVAALELWILSTPLTSNFLLSSIEDTDQATQVASADVAIVLGGVFREANGRRWPDVTGSVDRILETGRLLKEGRVRSILVTGGNVPWTRDTSPEARHIADFLVEWGIPSHSILIEGKSRNTWENAKYSKLIWDKNEFKSGFLVTSATHMPRALAVFRKAGFEVFPYPTDFQASPTQTGVLAVLPDVGALEGSTIAIREFLGRVIYMYQGWI